MGMRTRQRGQVTPGDQAVGLRTQPLEHAGVGESIERVDVAGSTLELKGNAVYSKKTDSGTIKLGVLLLGKPQENIDFVKALVRFHHYTKKSTLTGAD